MDKMLHLLKRTVNKNGFDSFFDTLSQTELESQNTSDNLTKNQNQTD